MLIIHLRTPRPSPEIYKEYRYPCSTWNQAGLKSRDTSVSLGKISETDFVGRITGPLVFPGEVSICDQAK